MKIKKILLHSVSLSRVKSVSILTVVSSVGPAEGGGAACVRGGDEPRGLTLRPRRGRSVQWQQLHSRNIFKKRSYLRKCIKLSYTGNRKFWRSNNMHCKAKTQLQNFTPSTIVVYFTEITHCTPPHPNQTISL